MSPLQVQQLFPHVSLSAITEDLQHSGSIEATVENILEGAVLDQPAPPMFTSDEPAAEDGPHWSPGSPRRENTLQTRWVTEWEGLL